MIERPSARANGPSRAALVIAARSWIGTPWRHQASARGAGTDCLGLVRGIWREFYGDEPEPVPAYRADHVACHGDGLLREAAGRWLVEQRAGVCEPGDVVLFSLEPGGAARHLGIIADADRFIHAYAGRAVCESWLSRWWLARLAGSYRFPGVAP